MKAKLQLNNKEEKKCIPWNSFSNIAFTEELKGKKFELFDLKWI